jgi:hypothetical protein
MKKNIFFQNKVVMHVLYYLLKKLMEPPFSEYLVLLKNRVTFSYSFIFKFFFFFSELLNYCDLEKKFFNVAFGRLKEAKKYPCNFFKKVSLLNIFVYEGVKIIEPFRLSFTIIFYQDRVKRVLKMDKYLVWVQK